MAHRALNVARVLLPAVLPALLASLSCACGNAPYAASASHADAGAAVANAPPYAADEAGWGKFHSRRHLLSISLPDGKAWKIDDHRQPELVATHPPTRSRLTVLTTREEELANQTRCEARARALGWVPKAALTTVEDTDLTGPGDYRSRVWVAVDASRPDGGLEGHVFLFGAFLRGCLLVHLVTGVPSTNEEEVLATRLAIATTRVVKGLTLDAPRTTDEATVPRDKPDIRR